MQGDSGRPMKKKDPQRLLQFPSILNLEPGGKAEVKPVLDKDVPDWKRDLAQRVEEHRKKKELQEHLQQPEPSPGAPAPNPEYSLQEKLEDTHRRLFKDVEITLDREEGDPWFDDSALPFDELDLAKNPVSSPQQLAPLEKERPGEGKITPDEFGLSLEEVLERRKLLASMCPEPAALDRTILISRLLAGLIDLVVVLGLTALLMGIVAWSTSAAIFTPSMGWVLVGLAVLLHYVYSFFFLFLAGRTVGMFLTGLCVRYERKDRLPAKIALARISVYLLAAACLGVGLFWGIFDRELKCWHDILTDSEVVRIG